jgi:hypothetical protein
MLVESAEVASNEARVLVASLFGFRAGKFNGLFQEIDSDKPAIRESGVFGREGIGVVRGS